MTIVTLFQAELVVAGFITQQDRSRNAYFTEPVSTYLPQKPISHLQPYHSKRTFLYYSITE